jgi:hypothetical protein
MEVILKEKIHKDCNLIGFINGDLVIDFPWEGRAYKLPKNAVQSLREILND